MKLSDFDYNYPEELVAQHPLPDRTSSKMMVVSLDSGTHQHRTVRDLPEFLRKGDVVVINTTKVLPVRLLGKKESGGSVEVLLLKPEIADVNQRRGDPVGGSVNARRSKPSGAAEQRLGGETATEASRRADDRILLRRPYIGTQCYWCLTSHTKRLKPEMRITFSDELSATVGDRNGDEVLLSFNYTGNFDNILQHIGLPPLPPYIIRNDSADYSAEDRNRYQTVFAQHAGSAAAPTAGLHLTDALLAQLRAQGVHIAEVVLHVGRDTFQPVRVENVADHQMHGEEWTISEESADIINRAKLEGRRVIAVGTTSVRALESAWDMDQGKLIPGKNTTQIFITPGYIFRVIDGLMTNFHQPKSTLIMLVSALLGRERVLALYAEAIQKRYRLFSFGDCMLIL